MLNGRRRTGGPRSYEETTLCNSQVSFNNDSSKEQSFTRTIWQLLLHNASRRKRLLTVQHVMTSSVGNELETEHSDISREFINTQSGCDVISHVFLTGNQKQLSNCYTEIYTFRLQAVATAVHQRIFIGHSDQTQPQQEPCHIIIATSLWVICRKLHGEDLLCFG